MAGHSKWHNIKNQKAKTDARKGQVFGQLARLIRAAVKEGGSGDPNSNATLRTLLEKARAENMPKEKVERAINTGLGKGVGGDLKEVVYEAFGAGGVGFLVVTVTNNANRTTSELREIFERTHGSIGAPGSVMYMFSRGADGGYVSNMPWPVEDQQQQQSLQNLLDELNMHDDVEEVFCAAEWSGKE
jgi:YebC/PmpR family DNA-binding regulatory protein